VLCIVVVTGQPPGGGELMTKTLGRLAIPWYMFFS